ncbi:hypothetical protein CVT24_006502 [Panaeolus cyanescens]|uniref:G domain-containing protein n=1 Tax=Panaeolus cyanescens TaxID=181874 RepID=A0A409WIE2_9AGAR|nr:hypothetical protein CVT24_006502 [Panaeolus cyanescens]
MFSKLLPKNKSDSADTEYDGDICYPPASQLFSSRTKPRLVKNVSVADIASLTTQDYREKEKGGNIATKAFKAAFHVLKPKKSRNRFDGVGSNSDTASEYDTRSLPTGPPSRKGSRSTLYHGVDLGSLPDRDTFGLVDSQEVFPAAVMDTDDLLPQDIIFAIMGPSGVGKSSFISAITGHQDVGVQVGHTLKSCTSSISVVKIDIPGTRYRLVLVDTPGFDDSHKNDSEILTVIADWLYQTYNNQVLLSGVIYLHRITDNRYDMSAQRTLRLFQALTGVENFERIALVTTMWDQLIEDVSEASNRQQLLEEEYWVDLIEGGALTHKFRNTKSSALDILWPLIEQTWQSRAPLYLQNELCIERKQLPKTEVGKQVFSRLDAILYPHQRRLNELRATFFKLVIGDNHQHTFSFLSPWLSSDQASEFSAQRDEVKKEATWSYALRKSFLGITASPGPKRPTPQRSATTETERCVGRIDEYGAIVCLVDVQQGVEGLSAVLKGSSSGTKGTSVPIVWVKMGVSSSEKDKSTAFQIDSVISKSVYAPKDTEELLTFKERRSNQLGSTSEQILDVIMGKLDAGEVQLRSKLSALQNFSFLSSRTSNKIQTEELKSTDYIIAVMGPTGAGKSTFIKTLTGYDLEIGHSLESCTSEISIVTLTIPEVTDMRVVVVDTPGFDDTHKSDLEIFKYISEWLNKTYTKGALLSGILYFHRISDNRMAGTPLKNLQMFQSLCGKDAYDKITLVTTMWDEVDEDVGVFREKQLKEKYWKPMIDGRKDKRAQMERFVTTQQSAIKVLLKSLGEHGSRQRTLQLQKEIDQLGRDLPETHAGKRMYSKLEALYERQQKVLEDLRKELKQEDTDQTIVEMLKEEHQKAAQEMEALAHDLQQMKLTVPARLLNHLRSGLDLKWKWGV